jgi:hypothetical protein
MKRERTAFDTVPQGVDFALPVPERAGPSPWRSAVDVKDDEPLSAAVVDWSALHHTWCLFEAPDTIPDPFIALLDLSTVIGALIFHDVVLVIDHDRIASRINGLFGIEGVVRGLEAPSRWGDESVDERIEKHFLDAQLELEQATRDHEPWIGWLCDRWERLLPSAQFPRHDAPAYERESQGQLRELDEPRQFGPYFGGPRRWESLFALEGRWYRARLDQEYGDLILDNDRRALFYDRLLEDMRAQHGSAPFLPRHRRYAT